MTQTNRITIASLRATYLVPREHPAPVQVRERLDLIVRGHLARQVRQFARSMFDSHDPSLWFIRRLNLGLAVNPDSAETEVARDWGLALTGLLRQTLANGAN